MLITYLIYTTTPGYAQKAVPGVIYQKRVISTNIGM